MSTRIIKIILIGLAAAMLIFMILITYPLFNKIKDSSASFIFQKKEQAELIFRRRILLDSPRIPVSPPLILPVRIPDFIAFSRQEAAFSGLTHAISTLSQEEENQESSFLMFKLTLKGTSAAFLNFLEKMESADYLIHVSSFNLLRKAERDEIEASLSIKVYGKVF